MAAKTPTATDTPPTTGKPSTPSPASAQLPDLSQMLNLPLRVSVAPLAGETGPAKSVEGALFTYDSSFVVLASPEAAASARPATPNLGASKGAGDSAAPRRTFTFLRTSQISSVTVLSPSPTDTTLPASDAPLPSLPSSPTELSARVDRAVAEDRKARARLAPSGTSPEAQGLFDALAKTLPVRWAGTSIVVLDEVVIESPYEPANVKGAKGSADRVERIKKMVRPSIAWQRPCLTLRRIVQVEGLRARLGMGSPAF